MRHFIQRPVLFNEDGSLERDPSYQLILLAFLNAGRVRVEVRVDHLTE